MPEPESRGVVLLIEDEQRIADLERLYLAKEGFAVRVVRDGLQALPEIRRVRPAVIVLDVGLPGLDGFSVLSELRAAQDWTPVIVVTALDEEADRLHGFGAGADDYLTKPFSPRELVARVHAVLRRAGPRPGAGPMLAGQLRLDVAGRNVTLADEPLHLSQTEFDLLAHLLHHAGRVVPRNELLSQVWGYTAPGGTRTVDVHVAQLRAKLGSVAGSLTTVRGVGYRWDT